MKLIVLLVAVIGVAALQVSTVGAASSRVDRLRQTEKEQVRLVESAKHTLRFFERHRRLLYAKDVRVKRRAWHEVAVARQRIILGRRTLARIRKEIARLARPTIRHRREWLCIHGGEAPWNYDKDAPGHNGRFDGGLQMDEEFQKTYGRDLYRAKGTADRWTPEEQMMVAERAWRTRGFGPWPTTARACGLL